MNMVHVVLRRVAFVVHVRPFATFPVALLPDHGHNVELIGVLDEVVGDAVTELLTLVIHGNHGVNRPT